MLGDMLELGARSREEHIAAMKRAEPELMKAAQHNIIHRNNANRKVSRLTHQIAKLGQ